MGKKIIFLHGFFATGSCIPALSLQEAFRGRAEVISPDLPLLPRTSLSFIRNLCEAERPDLLVGNSCGSFLAQMIAPDFGIPALLGNPHFEMTKFLKTRIGRWQYKAPRRDGKQELIIDEQLIEEFAELESIQFSHCRDGFRDKIWGLFGEKDTLAHYEPTFLQHYTTSFHFPGGHTPTAEEVKKWYAPLTERMLTIFSTT